MLIGRHCKYRNKCCLLRIPTGGRLLTSWLFASVGVELKLCITAPPVGGLGANRTQDFGLEDRRPDHAGLFFCLTTSHWINLILCRTEFAEYNRLYLQQLPREIFQLTEWFKCEADDKRLLQNQLRLAFFSVSFTSAIT